MRESHATLWLQLTRISQFFVKYIRHLIHVVLVFRHCLLFFEFEHPAWILSINLLHSNRIYHLQISEARGILWSPYFCCYCHLVQVRRIFVAISACERLEANRCNHWVLNLVWTGLLKNRGPLWKSSRIPKFRGYLLCDVLRPQIIGVICSWSPSIPIIARLSKIWNPCSPLF